MKNNWRSKKLASWKFLGLDSIEVTVPDHEEIQRRNEYCRVMASPTRSRDELKLALSETAARLGDCQPPTLRTVRCWLYQLNSIGKSREIGPKSQQQATASQTNIFKE